MSSHRKTAVLFFKDGDHDVLEDDWRSLKPTVKQRCKWKGYTDFYVPESVLNKVALGNDTGRRKSRGSERQLAHWRGAPKKRGLTPRLEPM